MENGIWEVPEDGPLRLRPAEDADFVELAEATMEHSSLQLYLVLRQLFPERSAEDIRVAIINTDLYLSLTFGGE